MTKVVFGTRQIGGAPSYKNFSERKAAGLLEYAYEKGLRIYDTAPIYGNGRSEKYIGKYLSTVRKNISIVTKFGFDLVCDGGPKFNFTHAGICAQLEQSLERLRTDYIDSYLLHIPDISINVSEVISTLNGLKQKGYIKSYGLCNVYDSLLGSFLSHPSSQVEYIQDFYNIIEKKAENLIFPYLKKSHNFMAYSPLYRGLLTDIDIKELLGKQEDGIDRLLKHQGFPIILKKRILLQQLAKKKGVSISKLSIDFLKSNTQVSHILFGTTSKKNLDMFLSLF